MTTAGQPDADEIIADKPEVSRSPEGLCAANAQAGGVAARSPNHVIDEPGRTAREMIAAAWNDMRLRAGRGELIRADKYVSQLQSLSPPPSIADANELLVDLIYGEFVTRSELGDEPDKSELLRRFPNVANLLRKQFALHEALHVESLIAANQMTITAGTAPPDSGPVPQSVPTAIGKYRVINVLGEGSQAIVYRAVHPGLDRDVVIKLSRKAPLATPEQRNRLVTEGRILAGLKHPNLAQVYDVDFYEECPYLVFDYVKGVSLSQFCQRRSPTPAAAACIVACVARALDTAHRAGILHLDVKPANILVDEQGMPRLIDFGLSRKTATWGDEVQHSDSISGTVPFMAPEQARGDSDRISSRSDVFALGAVLFYMLTGIRPFEGKGLIDSLHRAQSCDFRRDALERPEIPARLRNVCLQAMAADPAARFASAEIMANELEAFSRRRLPAAFKWAARVALIAVSAVLILYGFNHWLPKATVSVRRSIDTNGPQQSIRANLVVRIFRNDASIDLADAAPLIEGDELQIETDVPSGMHAVLFLVNGEGRLQILDTILPDDQPRRWQYPHRANQTVSVQGSPGTECLMIAGRPSGPIGRDQLELHWKVPDAWPRIPATSLLRMTAAGVEVEQQSRDLSPPRDHVTPVTTVRSVLDEFRRSAAKGFPLLEGVAFLHDDREPE